MFARILGEAWTFACIRLSIHSSKNYVPSFLSVVLIRQFCKPHNWSKILTAACLTVFFADDFWIYKKEGEVSFLKYVVVPYSNLDWPSAVAGEAVSVSSVSVSACHIGGPI